MRKGPKGGKIACAASITAVSIAALYSQRRNEPNQEKNSAQRLEPNLLLGSLSCSSPVSLDFNICSPISELATQIQSIQIQGIAGAIGECLSMLLFYPLDTIKVRCQAIGLSSTQVIQELMRTSKGIKAVLSSFYAGCIPAVFFSIPIGAVHFASFETSKRLLVDKTACGDGSEGNSDQQRLMANVFAAVFAAVSTAVIESPVELFRHNQQASTSGASFIVEMAKVFRTSGLSGLYWGFLPHCFESLPHDIAELLTYGALIDYHTDALKKTDPPTQWVRDLASNGHPATFDLAIGALAGAASVLVSMPFDSVKTFVQTHGSCDLSKTTGVLESGWMFYSSGKEMVRLRGLGSLYAGIIPRLIQRVPSSMLNWLVIAQVSRYLHDRSATIHLNEKI